MRYKSAMFDLDGTIHVSGRPYPGALDALAGLAEAGVALLYVSNNSTMTSATYAVKLRAMGLGVDDRDVITSGEVTADWLVAHHRGDRIYAISEPELAADLRRRGLTLVEAGDPADVVLAAFDRTFDYAKWTAGLRALKAGARFVATSPDITCPVEDGEIPDCGGIVAALEAVSGRTVDVVVGKPSSIMLDACLDRLGLQPADVLMVGDRLQTDIALGFHGGLDTVLVLTGVATRAEAAVSTTSPTHVIESIADLPARVLGTAAR